jgi:hypothetical protein
LHLGNLEEMSSVALAVWVASALTSDATTANPRPGLAGARRFDRGVERQQIGLTGNVADKAHDLIDLLRGAGEGPIVSLAVPAMPEARCTIVVASLTCVLIACTESPSWLAAVATV